MAKRIRSVHIKAFKGLKNVRLDDLEGVNVLVGRNNSGKSSILHALELAGIAISSQPWDRFPAKLNIRDLFDHAGDFDVAVTFSDGTASGVKIAGDYIPRPYSNAGDPNAYSSVLIHPTSLFSFAVRGHRTPKKVIEAMESRQFDAVGSLDMLYAIKYFGEHGDSRYTGAFSSIISDVEAMFPEVSGILSDRTSEDISTLTYSELGKRMDILYAGTGMRHFLEVLIKARLSRASLVLLDEPESGLHPDLQRRFVDKVRELNAASGVQFLMASHSPVFLNHAASLGVFRVVSVGGVREVRRVPSSARSEALGDLGIRPSDVFGSDICVFVEGVMDVIYFDYILKTLYASEFAGVTVAVVQYGGGAAMPIVAGTLSLGNLTASQTRGLWILDRDAKPGDPPKSDKLAFEAALGTAGAKTHILSVREIEFCIPESIHVAVQGGDPTKEAAVRSIHGGSQANKFRADVASAGAVVLKADKLQALLPAHLTAKANLPTEIRGLIEGQLFSWRDELVGP